MKKETSRLILYQLCRSREIITKIYKNPERAREITESYGLEVAIGVTDYDADEFFSTEYGKQIAKQFNVE